MSNEIFLIENHADRGLSRFTSYFKDSTNLREFTRILLEEVQEVENMMISLMVERTLDSAVGAQLDQWGEVLGEPRAGQKDTSYRGFLKARLLTNLAEGEIERLIEITHLITKALKVSFMPVFPAGFIIQYERDGFLGAGTRRRIKRQIESATSAGVGVAIVEANVGAFGFADDPTAQGFGLGEWAEQLE